METAKKWDLSLAILAFVVALVHFIHEILKSQGLGDDISPE